VTLEFRALGESDLEAMIDIRVRAFGPMSAEGSERWLEVNRALVGEGRLGGVFDGEILAGSGKARGFAQAWHGRVVPVAGMAGITVLPEYRGRGVGTLLMRRLAEEAVRRGEPLSALYPQTVPVYRRLGWELVGAQTRYALPAHQLRLLGGGARVWRLGVSDVAAVTDLMTSSVARERASGPLVWSAEDWRRVLQESSRFAYGCEDGLVVYGWDGSDLSVDLLWASTVSTARTLWSLVGSGSSVAKTGYAYRAPDDPVFWLLPEEPGHEVVRHGWMLRILDVPSALEYRGYPDGLACELTFTLDDPERPENCGFWRLQVENGRARVERAEAIRDGLSLSAHGLAALYAGRPLAVLRRAGLVDGGSAREAVSAVAVCCTPTPLLSVYF
jgi:predicted acetyltransferase